MESGAGMPEQDKDPRVQEKPDDQKGGPEVTSDARSAGTPMWDSGGLSPFLPRPGPGPLQRNLHTQRSEIPSDQTSQPSGISKRNAIHSSYSSTGGFLWLKRRKKPASSHCQLPLTSSKTVSEVSPQAVSQGQAQCEKAADSAPGEKPAPRSGSPHLRPLGLINESSSCCHAEMGFAALSRLVSNTWVQLSCRGLSKCWDYRHEPPHPNTWGGFKPPGRCTSRTKRWPGPPQHSHPCRPRTEAEGAVSMPPPGKRQRGWTMLESSGRERPRPWLCCKLIPAPACSLHRRSSEHLG
uniref:Uncharacterized protein n=1 Tax=Callithrix jacchus TaxID=9483 RepID=A0A8I3WEA2_CALJA